MLAVGMDGNNQILSIAMGVTHGETGASCTWFINRLKECIGEVLNLCIISDRHPTIILACKTVFSNSFHGYCDRHLMMYFKKRSDSVQKLEIVGIDKWSRANFPANCFNYMTSNSVESINSLSRQKYEDAPTDELTPWEATKVNDKMLNSQSWRVNDIDALKIYRVFYNKSEHEVDCINFLRTCRKWKLSGLPCGHVCAVSRVCGLTNCVTTINVETAGWKTQKYKPYTSRGETPSQAGCSRCCITGHNRNSCTQPLPSHQGTHKQKWRSNNTHITQEPLIREPLLDEERARNGRIYQDWDDLVQEEIKRKFTSSTDLPVPFTKIFMGLREWDGPAEWRQYSYNLMNNFMPTAGYSNNNTYDPTQPSSSYGYMLHQNAEESSTPYESYHMDDM
uniref:Zinc finger PMZ-type domain-containing protein n=1 Tax=Tanacetum cinerariifolium TaxID=118510 RepID=A0A6L2K3E7_TANCI|nr:hypothetical protein [Tanacetum cinerariifolium]